MNDEQLPDDSAPDVSEEHPESERWVWMGKHRPPVPKRLLAAMASDWAPAPFPKQRHVAADRFAQRRQRLSEQFAGKNIVVPTGPLKVRSNDTDYRFRPGSDFYWLTGGSEPDSVLVMHADGDGHHATLYVEPRSDRSSHRFFTDARYGEFWIGARMGIDETAHFLDIETKPLGALDADLEALDAASTVTVSDMDPAVDERFAADDDDAVATALSDMRMIKDDFEVAQVDDAVQATIRGFEDIVRALPEAMERGERVIEGVFALRARVEGNDVGYDTIAASGAHATILHWRHNNGEVRAGDLVLIDAGVENGELYTADVTRTLPVSGHFSPEQREVYELVLAAQKAGIEAVKPGADFTAPHNAAMRVLAEGLHRMGILSVDPDTALRRDNQVYRRYTLHGTSHMLGLDVHDCAHARDEHYRGPLKPGYLLTVEPGLYFQPDDLTVPERYRGIGVRIEDDVLVTEDGCRVLSAALPTDPDDIERWMKEQTGKPFSI